MNPEWISGEIVKYSTKLSPALTIGLRLELAGDGITHITNIFPGIDLGPRELDLEMFLNRHDKLDMIEGIPIINIPGRRFAPKNDAGIIDNVRENTVETIKNFYQGGHPVRAYCL